MSNTSRRVFFSSCSLGFLLLTAVQATLAAPPAPPPASASGVVYFEYNGAVMKMQGDGSQKSVVIPAEIRVEIGLASPSNLTYDYKPWWMP